MSTFRSPRYLDVETLVPLANYHDIEVMVEVAVSQRELGQRGKNAGARVSLPIPGSPGLEVGGTAGSETELTQARVVKDSPASALNRLLDTLDRGSGLLNDVSTDAVTRRALVDLDGEWEVAPATDIGALLAGVVALMAQNPGALTADKPPAELISLMTGPPQGGPIVLNRVDVKDDETPVLALLSSDHLIGGATLDDLEGQRSVFGLVDNMVSDGAEYSLEKFFLAGFGRAVRRAFDPIELLQSMTKAMGKSFSVDDMRLTGPLVVVKAVAVY